MLEPALAGQGSNGQALAALLQEIDLSDADWRVGNYQVLDEIGRGGMGVIYRARQRHSRRIVALKRVLSYHADSRETLARFRREAEAAASLDHPNILPIYEVGETEDGLPFFSMKLAVGGTLFAHKRSLRGETREIIRLVAKVTRAVQYAHGQGILHRDLKPGNILLDGRGEPLVSDFGLAKWLDTSSDLTRTLTIFGTPGYIAPEQAVGSAANLQPRADVYSIGAILFDLIAGRPPFIGEHALAVINQAREKPAPKLRSIVSKANRDLETICARCLERDPTARYCSAHDLATDLELWLEGRPIIARPVSPPVRVWRWSKRNPKLAGSIAACLVLGAIAGGFEIQNRNAERTAAMVMHSIAIEPFLDLDSAKYDANVSGALASALQRELRYHGPALVTTVSPARSTTGNETDANRWNGARTAVQGTKRIRDGKVRVSMRLLNAADGKVLYKKIIESDALKDTSDAVAKTTGANLYAILSQSDLSSAELTETDPGWRDPNTRELLIAGKAVLDRRDLVSVDRAIELFRQAVKTQPTSALAYSNLAEAQSGRAFLADDLNFVSAAAVSAKTALELDPKRGETHKAMSRVLFEQGRFRESLEEAFTAYELANNGAVLLTGEVAGNLRIIGSPAKAVAWYRMSKGARPAVNEFMIADCLVDMTEDEQAAAAYGRASLLRPELPEGWMGLCRLALLQKDFAGAHKIASENWTRYRDFVFSEEMAAQVAFFSRNFSESEKLYQELAAKDPNGGGSFYGAVSYQSALGTVRLALGDMENGARILNAALAKELLELQRAPEHPEVLYRVAAIETSLDRRESALEHLRAAIKAGWIDYRSLSIDPRFDLLRADSRYQEILDSMATRVASFRRSAPAEAVAKIGKTGGK